MPKAILWILCCSASDTNTNRCPLPSLLIFLRREMTYKKRRARNIYVSVKRMISWTLMYQPPRQRNRTQQHLRGPCASLPAAFTILTLQIFIFNCFAIYSYVPKLFCFVLPDLELYVNGFMLRNIFPPWLLCARQNVGEIQTCSCL